MKRLAPSIASLVETFRITDDEARAIRVQLQRGNMVGVADDPAKGFYGMEVVRFATGSHAFNYINTGDTYSPTIIRRAGSSRYYISTMGGEVEALERAGRKVY